MDRDAIGFLVATAGNGKGALALLDRQPPDVLIVDSVMPEMSGQELIFEIKALPEQRQRRLPIIILTGAGVGREKRDFLAGFSIPTIGKLWKRSELLGCIDDAIVGKGYRDSPAIRSGQHEYDHCSR